jgi:Fe-S-cluster containining protein
MPYNASVTLVRGWKKWPASSFCLIITGYRVLGTHWHRVVKKIKCPNATARNLSEAIQSAESECYYNGCINGTLNASTHLRLISSRTFRNKTQQYITIYTRCTGEELHIACCLTLTAESAVTTEHSREIKNAIQVLKGDARKEIRSRTQTFKQNWPRKVGLTHNGSTYLLKCVFFPLWNRRNCQLYVFMPTYCTNRPLHIRTGCLIQGLALWWSWLAQKCATWIARQPI